MPIGNYGTIPHVLTNESVQNKKSALKDVTKEAVKGPVKMYVAHGAIIGAGAGTTYVVNKFFPKAAQAVKTKLSTLTSKIGNVLSKVSINFSDGATSNLKELIKDTGIVDAVKLIPAPIKGALAAAAIISPIVGAYILDKSRVNMAVAEAKQETQQA